MTGNWQPLPDGSLRRHDGLCVVSSGGTTFWARIGESPAEIDALREAGWRIDIAGWLVTEGRDPRRRRWGTVERAMTALDAEHPADVRGDAAPESGPPRLTAPAPALEDADRTGPAGEAAARELSPVATREDHHERLELLDALPRPEPEHWIWVRGKYDDDFRRVGPFSSLQAAENHCDNLTREGVHCFPDESPPIDGVAAMLPRPADDGRTPTDESHQATDGPQAEPTTGTATATPPAPADALQAPPAPSGSASVKTPTTSEEPPADNPGRGSTAPKEAAGLAPGWGPGPREGWGPDPTPDNPAGIALSLLVHGMSGNPAGPAAAVTPTLPQSSPSTPPLPATRAFVRSAAEGGGDAVDHWTADARAMYLHKSHLAMLSRCELQYEKRYIEGIKSPPRAVLARGIAAHSAVNYDLAAKLNTGALLADDDLRDAAADAFELEWGKGVELEGPGSGIDPDEVKALGKEKIRGAYKDQTIAAATVYHTDAAPHVYPIENGLERPFRLKLKGQDFGLAGTIDIIEADRVRDLKTATKSPGRGEADSALELTMYGLAIRVAEGRAPSEVTLDKMVTPPTAKPYVRTLRSTRGPADFQALIKRAALAAQRIRSGVLMPAPPDSWACSPRWCGYWETCPFGQRARAGRPIAKGATP